MITKNSTKIAKLLAFQALATIALILLTDPLKALPNPNPIIKEKFSCDIALKNYTELSILILSKTFKDVSKYQLLRERREVSNALDSYLSSNPNHTCNQEGK